MPRPSQGAPPDLRILQFDTATGSTGNALTNYNTTQLPNGALAFVNSTGTLYYFDNTGTAAAVDAVVVVPATGGPGRWFALIGDGAGSAIARLTTAGTASNGGPTSTNWAATGDAAYELATFSEAAFSVAATTGIVTYTGPTRRFVITGSISFAVALVAAVTSIDFDIQRSPGDVLIGTANASPSSVMITPPANAAIVSSSIFRKLVLSSGNTIQGVVRNNGSTSVITTHRMQLQFLATG